MASESTLVDNQRDFGLERSRLSHCVELSQFFGADPIVTAQNEIVRERPALANLVPQWESARLRPSFRWADLIDAPLHDFPLRDEILFQFAPIAQGMDVLEIGPGSGNTAFRLRRVVSSLTLLDAAPELLEALRKQLGHFKNIHFLCMNLSKLNMTECPQPTFDLIYGLDVFEYISNPGACLQTMARALRPGGCLFLTFPNTPPPKGDGVTWFEHSADLEALLHESGFRSWEMFGVQLRSVPAALFEILHEMPLRLYRRSRRGKGRNVPQTYEETWAFQNKEQFVRYKPVLHFFWFLLGVMMRVGGDVFTSKRLPDPILGNQLVVRAWR
jgi:ubiquinone/menaquinone biosynthesis C-methylase UbiE